MARWTASAKWAVGPALDGRRDMPLALRLSEGLGLSARFGCIVFRRAAANGYWLPAAEAAASVACIASPSFILN